MRQHETQLPIAQPFGNGLASAGSVAVAEPMNLLEGEKGLLQVAQRIWEYGQPWMGNGGKMAPETSILDGKHFETKKDDSHALLVSQPKI